MQDKLRPKGKASDPVTNAFPEELAALRAGAKLAGVELEHTAEGLTLKNSTDQAVQVTGAVFGPTVRRYSAPEISDRDPVIDKAAARWHSEDPRVLLLRALAEATERDAAVEAVATRVEVRGTRIPAGATVEIGVHVLEPVYLIALELDPTELQGLELERLVVGTRIVAMGGMLLELNRCWLPQLRLTPSAVSSMQLVIRNGWGDYRTVRGSVVCRREHPR